jgi:molybdopterin-guanine dinucleotide biosynthesis protein A
VNTAILAGGGATRFGGKPKGLELVGGRRILDRLVDACVEAFGRLPLLVANDPAAATWRHDLRVVGDVRPGLGALGGIHTASIEAPAPVVCIAWDMPFVSADLIRLLGAGLDGVDACLPASGSRRGVEPLCAAYGPACLAAIERAVEAGDLRAIGFHPWIRVRTLAADDLPADPGRLFFNINSPADLATAESIIGPLQT